MQDYQAEENTSGLRKVLPEMGWTPSYWSVSQLAEMSFKALGMHTYLMSRPDGWIISGDRIARERKEGRSSVQATLRELESFDLLERSTIQDEAGKITTRTTVFAVPRVGKPIDGKPTSGVTSENTVSPQVAPEVGKPTDGKPPSFKERVLEEIPKKDKNLYARTFPNDWKTPQNLYEWAFTRHQLTPALVNAELERWRDHHLAKGSKMKDWEASARLWLSNHVRWNGKNGNGEKSSNRSTSDDRAQQALDVGAALVAKIAAGGPMGLLEGGGYR